MRMKDEPSSGGPGHLNFALPVSLVEGEATVGVVGELDCHTAPRLQSTLGTLVDDGARHVTVDLSDTSFMDSTGLSALVAALKGLRERGGDMVITSPNAAVRRLFEMTGLDTVFTVR